MLDLDEFKKINDQHGHLFGDVILKTVAEEIRQSIGEDDVISRYGGEEFSVIVTHRCKENIKDVSERIRKKVESLCFDNDAKITLSIGVSCFVLHDDLESLIKKADDNLYKAKAQGKNLVVGC